MNKSFESVYNEMFKNKTFNEVTGKSSDDNQLIEQQMVFREETANDVLLDYMQMFRSQSIMPTMKVNSIDVESSEY